jgi:hypothetical protein
MLHPANNGRTCFCENMMDEMDGKSLRYAPLAAFLLTTIAVTGYVILLNQWLLEFGFSNAVGQFLSIGVPILLSAACYMSIAHDNSSSKLVVRSASDRRCCSNSDHRMDARFVCGLCLFGLAALMRRNIANPGRSS